MIVLGVTGSRNLFEWHREMVEETINFYDPVKVKVGCARGADRLATEWTLKSDVPYKVFKADWSTHGKAAGPLRNAALINSLVESQKQGFEVTLVGFLPIELPNKGTRNCLTIAKEAGVNVHEMRFQLFDGFKWPLHCRFLTEAKYNNLKKFQGEWKG